MDDARHSPEDPVVGAVFDVYDALARHVFFFEESTPSGRDDGSYSEARNRKMGLPVPRF